MPSLRIDFYLLEQHDPQARWLIACRLIEKAYIRGHTVYVHCDHQKDAETIDELLWTFKEESFIPHNLQGEGPKPPPPVQIGYGAEPKGFNDILLNLSRAIPEFHQRFKRVIEIVSGDEQAKNLSREHYRQYRAQGYELFTHPIK